MNLAMFLVLAFACLAKVFAVCTVVQHEKNGLQIDLMEPTLALVLSMVFAVLALVVMFLIDVACLLRLL